MERLLMLVAAILTILVAQFFGEIRVFITRHRKLIRPIMFFVAAAIYLNIGWAIGTYYHAHIFSHAPETFWQVVWRGGYGLINGGVVNDSLLASQIFLMFLWPAVVGALVPITWVIYALHRLAVLVWHSIVFFLWLSGAGGIAKLLGVG